MQWIRMAPMATVMTVVLALSIMLGCSSPSLVRAQNAVDCTQHSCFAHSYQVTQYDGSLLFLEWNTAGHVGHKRTIRGWSGVSAADGAHGESTPFTGYTWGTGQSGIYKGVQLLLVYYQLGKPFPTWIAVYRRHNPYNVGGFAVPFGSRMPVARALKHPDMKQAWYRVKG